MVGDGHFKQNGDGNVNNGLLDGIYSLFMGKQREVA
jgi:hypothetical protein